MTQTKALKDFVLFEVVRENDKSHLLTGMLYDSEHYELFKVGTFRYDELKDDYRIGADYIFESIEMAVEARGGLDNTLKYLEKNRSKIGVGIRLDSTLGDT